MDSIDGIPLCLTKFTAKQKPLRLKSITVVAFTFKD